MRYAIVASAGTDEAAVDVMNVFIKHSAQIVSVTDNGLAGQADRFHIFGIVEDVTQEMNIVAEL